jgi:hypothetical protein
MTGIYSRVVRSAVFVACAVLRGEAGKRKEERFGVGEERFATAGGSSGDCPRHRQGAENP